MFAPSPASLVEKREFLQLDSDTNSVGIETRHLPCLLLEEFLVHEELTALLEYTLAHENYFSTSQVLSSAEAINSVSEEHRRSRVLADPGHHRDILVARIQSYLPRILEALHLPIFSISRIEAQITASNDGDFFKAHTDNGHSSIDTRLLTFVYFFYREPRAFTGGELRIYNPTENVIHSQGSKTITPRQNLLVLFPSSLVHEILPVQCSSRKFADSRFTLNGWFRR